MAESYSVKVNRPDGLVVEISGEDKDWVSAQLKELAPVWNGPPSNESSGEGQGSGAPGPDAAGKRRSTKPRVQEESGEPSTKKARRAGGERVERDETLAAKLTPPEVRGKLEAYVEDRRTAYDKAQPNQAAIIATFLQDEVGQKSVDDSQLYTVYDVMGWPGPGRPRATLDNARRRENFFSAKNGIYTLTHTGERYGRHESRNTEAE